MDTLFEVCVFQFDEQVTEGKKVEVQFVLPDELQEALGGGAMEGLLSEMFGQMSQGGATTWEAKVAEEEEEAEDI